MPLNDTLLNIGNAAMQTAAAYAQVHNATPNGSGSNEASSARQSITWVTAANGDMVSSTTINFTGGAANGAALYLGFWSASTGGTFYGYVPLTGDTTFSSGGAYNVTGITVTGTAT